MTDFKKPVKEMLYCVHPGMSGAGSKNAGSRKVPGRFPEAMPEAMPEGFSHPRHAEVSADIHVHVKLFCLSVVLSARLFVCPSSHTVKVAQAREWHQRHDMGRRGMREGEGRGG